MANVLTETIPKVSVSGILGTVFTVLIVLIVLVVVGFMLHYFFKKKKYNEYRVEILDKDSNGNVYKTYDRAGVIYDKTTQLRLLFLEKTKVGMDPNNIPYISHKDAKGRLIKTIYLRKIGVNNYVFLNLKLGESLAITVGEEDLNNAQQEMVKIRRTYNKDSWLAKYAPYIAFILTILIVMIILISLFNKFGVIKEASENMVKVSELQLRIMQTLTNSSIGSPNVIGNPISTVP
jgi:Na+-transporting methylmalonyl-CoA/oxaloacetate decarboxylase gamma subunit